MTDKKEENKIDELTVIKKDEDTKLLGKKYTYKIDDEKELLKVEIDKNLVLRVLELPDKKMVDIRKYYKGFPTKRGVRFSYDVFETIKKIMN